MGFGRPFVPAVLALAVVGGIGASSDAVITPQTIVTDPTPSFSVSARVDMDPSGRGTPLYVEDDPIALSVEESEDAFVYVFSVSARGGTSQLYPNRHDGFTSFLRANRALQLLSSRYTLSVSRLFGTDKVIAVAHKQELEFDTRSLASHVSQVADGACGADCFASARWSPTEFAQTLSLVVGGNSQESRVTDTVQSQIRRRWWW